MFLSIIAKRLECTSFYELIYTISVIISRFQNGKDLEQKYRSRAGCSQAIVKLNSTKKELINKENLIFQNFSRLIGGDEFVLVGHSFHKPFKLIPFYLHEIAVLMLRYPEMPLCKLPADGPETAVVVVEHLYLGHERFMNMKRLWSIRSMSKDSVARSVRPFICFYMS